MRLIAGRKQALVEQALLRGGVEAFPGSVRWVRHLRETGVRTAVVSSSANADAVLYAAGISDLFDAHRRRRRRRAARPRRQARS